MSSSRAIQEYADRGVFFGDFCIFVAMAIFGSYGLFLKLAPQIPTLVFLFGFQFVGVIAFAIPAWRGSRVRRDMFGRLALLAVVAVVHDLVLFGAFRLTTIANAAFAHQTVSLFLLWLAPLLLREKSRGDERAALVISLLGLALLYLPGFALPSAASHVIGLSLGVLSGVFYALLIIFYRYLPRQGLEIATINFWRYLFSAIMLTPIWYFLSDFDLSPRNLGTVLAFGLLFAVIGTFIHGVGMARSRALRSSIIAKMEPICAVVYAAVLLNERPSAATLIGGGLILGATAWLAVRGNRPEPVRETACPAELPT